MNEKLKESSLTINIEESILDDVLNRVKNSRLITKQSNSLFFFRDNVPFIIIKLIKIKKLLKLNKNIIQLITNYF